MRAMRGDLKQSEAASAGNREADPAQHKFLRHHISLRLSLIVLVLVCVIPALTVCSYLVYANYQLEKQQVYANTELFSRQIVAELDRELAAIESGLRVLATAESLKNGDLRRFHQIARDALLRLSGLDPVPPRPLLTVESGNPIHKQPGRREYLRGQVVAVDGRWQVKTMGNQGSGVLRSMSEANCFVVLPEDCAGVQVGDNVQVQLFEGIF